MTIQLRPMTPEEFAPYLAVFLPDYAREVQANYGLTQAEAIGRVTREIETDLPDGVRTPGHVLVCLIQAPGSADERIVGYLWYKPDAAARSAFIYDFCILDALQGQGFGRAALQALKTDLADQGIAELRLRVAKSNARAFGLYQSLGFQVTGLNMCWRFDAP